MNDIPGTETHDISYINQPVHVLLAEDNLLLQQAIKIVLVQHGFTVFVAKNGKQAVEQMKKHPVDVVLMAINMPEMSGVEATIAIRTFNQFTPIIAFTSYDEASILEPAKQAGMNGFLSKYASPQHIAETIRQYAAFRQIS